MPLHPHVANLTDLLAHSGECRIELVGPSGVIATETGVLWNPTTMSFDRPNMHSNKWVDVPESGRYRLRLMSADGDELIAFPDQLLTPDSRTQIRGSDPMQVSLTQDFGALSQEHRAAWGDTLEIGKYLVLSTAHITKADSEVLTESSVYDANEYGFWVYTKHDDYPGLSESFLKCIRLARENQCTYLRLDCDGALYERSGLDTHEW